MTDLAKAAENGRLAGLRALREQLTAWIAECDSMRDRAALSQRLMDCLEQIEAAEKANPVVKGTALDELAKRRAKPARPSRTAKSQ